MKLVTGFSRLLAALALLAAPAMLPAARAQAQATLAPDIVNYQIQPSDVIVVDVVGERDLEKKEFRVSSDGTISFPYLDGQEIKVADLSPADVAKTLRTLLIGAEIFVDPQILVYVREYRKRTVTVIGQVTKQGVVEFPSEQEMNILEAIGYAGGFTQLANKSAITVTRKGQQLKFNLKDWIKNAGRKGDQQEKLFMLRPGDQVFVPESIL
jgi:polysaccharide export outer membrane protein